MNSFQNDSYIIKNRYLDLEHSSYKKEGNGEHWTNIF